MIIPLLAAVIPGVISLVEKIIPQSNSSEDKTDFVVSLLGKIYDAYLKERVPDFPGIDERKLFIELGVHLVDFASHRVFNMKDAA